MKRTAVFLLKLYKILLSPILKQLFGYGCRFNPSCSEYASQAISRFGLEKGSLLFLKRFLRCHPKSRQSYYDPVPFKIVA